MTIVGPDILIYTITFIVPGYIISSTLAAMSSRAPTNPGESFLHYLTLSAVHNSPWAALVYWRLRDHLTSTADVQAYIADHMMTAAVAWLFIVLVSPFLAALGYEKLRKPGIPAWLWSKLGFEPLNTVPSAWDWGFQRPYENLYVAVTTKRGVVFYGKFGSDSYVSTSYRAGDIHIEEVYDVVDSEWLPRPESMGVTIKGDSIEYVEFWGLEPRKE